MTKPKYSNDLRNEFANIANHVLEEEQEAAGIPGPRMTVSIRADMEMVANIDELAERLNMTRQACITTILDHGVLDAVGGYLDAYGSDRMNEFQEAVHTRFLDFRNKQMDKFNAGEDSK